MGDFKELGDDSGYGGCESPSTVTGAIEDEKQTDTDGSVCFKLCVTEQSPSMPGSLNQCWDTAVVWTVCEK